MPRSILLVMGLAVGNNDEVTLAAEGENADAALEQLVELLKIDHDAS
jgi:phosphocarrier protein